VLVPFSVILENGTNTISSKKKELEKEEIPFLEKGREQTGFLKPNYLITN